MDVIFHLKALVVGLGIVLAVCVGLGFAFAALILLFWLMEYHTLSLIGGFVLWFSYTMGREFLNHSKPNKHIADEDKDDPGYLRY